MSPNGDRWSQEEDDLLRVNHERLSYRELSDLLMNDLGVYRTTEAVKSRCILIGLTRPWGCIANNRRDQRYMDELRSRCYERRLPV